MGIEEVRKIVTDILADKAIRGREDADAIRRLQAELLKDDRLDPGELAELERLFRSAGITRRHLRSQVDPVSDAVRDLFSAAKDALTKESSTPGKPEQTGTGALKDRLQQLESFLKRTFGYLDEPISEPYLPRDWNKTRAAAALKALKEAGKLGRITYHGVPEKEKVAVQYFLYKIASSERGIHSESDLVIPIKPGQLEPRACYTVRIDEFGNADIRRIGPFHSPPYPDPWPEKTDREATRDLEEKYGVTVQGENDGKQWKKAELAVLKVALEQLTPEEREIIRGAVFVRSRTGGQLGGAHKMDEHGRNVITIFDRAFYNDYFHFVGDRGDPDSLRTILHEVGHRLSRGKRLWQLEKEYRDTVTAFHQSETVKRYNALLAEYHQLTKSGNADPSRDSRRKALAAEIEILRPQVNNLAAQGEVVKRALAQAREDYQRDFVAYFAGHPRITGYAEQENQDQPGGEWEEFFAEAYSLYKLEPQLLRSEYPELYDYFKAGRYLK